MTHLPRTLLLPALALLLTACASTPYRMVEPATRAELDVQAVADRLGDADVVFLGEEHTNDTVHGLQFELTRALAERRPVVISMEQFERDVQGVLDRYLAGEIDEETFLAESRPWKNYDDYRPAIELARERGLRVVAANAPRPLAAKVSKEGLESVQGDPDVAAEVVVEDGAYRARFEEAMGGHGEGMDLDLFFAAQVLKDETMAESIERVLTAAEGEPPLVVHWCGKFHSDFGLGTVEALRRRLPELEVAIVSCSTGGVRRELEGDDLERGDVLILLP